MVQVSLTGSLRVAAKGEEKINIEAQSIRELMAKIVERYPTMNQAIEEGIAVAIDGEIYRDNVDVNINADSEVFLLPRIQGG